MGLRPVWAWSWPPSPTCGSAAPGAKFTAAHGRYNFPAEFGLSWVLPRIVGLSHANDILMSSRVFTAEEALTMGFLNRLLPANR